MQLSAWVLVMIFSSYNSGKTSVTIDMPDRVSCLAAGQWADENTKVDEWFCLPRYWTTPEE